MSTIQTSFDVMPSLDCSMAGEALLLLDLLPDAGPRSFVEVDQEDGSWSLTRTLVHEGWSAHTLRGADLIQGSLSSQVPEAFELLVLNRAESASALLESFNRHYRPGLIVMNDPGNELDHRSQLYLGLRQLGYFYVGLVGVYSIWTRVPVTHRTPNTSTVQALPQHRDASALAHFDPPRAILGSLGTIQPQIFLISGWAFLPATDSIPPLVYLRLRDEVTGLTQYVTAYRCRRPDVRAHFQRDSLEMSGFRALITVTQKTPAISLHVIQADASHWYSSDTTFSISRPVRWEDEASREGLAQKFLSGSGIEIGALQKPLSLPPSCQVRYVDRMSLPDLLHHYPELAQIRLQAPDIIDDGEQLSSIADNSQHFVIANHFFEHSQNPLQALTNFLRVLRTGGVLFLAVPDKRFTFDFERPSTRYSAIQQTFQTGYRADKQNLFREWAQMVDKTGRDSYSRADELMAVDYSIHYNVWTVDELLTQLLKARSEFHLPFSILSVVSVDNEAILLFEKLDHRD